MNRYLEKIAKEYIEQENVETGAGNKIGSGIVAALSAGLVSKKLSPMLQTPVMNTLFKKDPTIPLDVLENITNHALPVTNTTLNINKVGGNKATLAIMEMMGEKSGPYYMPKEYLEGSRKTYHRLATLGDKTVGRLGRAFGVDIPKYENQFQGGGPFTKNYIHFPVGKFKNTDVLAHELGHAVDYSTGPTGLKRAITRVGRRIETPAAALAGGMLASEKTRDYAWTVPLLASVPTMREELMANINAMKLIKQHGGNAKKFIPLAAANLLGYAIKPALTSGTIAGINHLKRKGEEVNPDEWLVDR